MASIILSVVCVILALYKIYKYMTFRPPNFPPGPPRIPIYGTYPLLLLLNWGHLHKAVTLLCKYYKTTTLGFYLGGLPCIVANDYEGIREMFFNRDFDGRSETYVAKARDPNHNLRGIFFTDGPNWKTQRRFMLRNLRDWGFGCRSEKLELEIHDEIMTFIEMIKDGPIYEHERKYFKGNAVMCPDIMFALFVNMFLETLCGERLPRKDNKAAFMCGEDAMVFQRSADNYGRLVSITPWVRLVFPNISGFKGIYEGNKGIYDYIKTVVDKNMKTYEAGVERHVIDLYISEIKKAEKEGQDTGFIYDDLVMHCTDFSFPPATALPQQMAFLFQRILLYPEVQHKMHAEIENVVGLGRLPSLDDRPSLPYTEATIREILRHETLVPSGLPHKAMVDSKFQGYDVPKDTIIVTGLHAMHHDPNTWGDNPYSFKPERFLGDDGKLSLKVDKGFPFGAGKRVCAGETFARNAMFLFTSAIFQNFRIKLPDGAKMPKLKDNLTGLITHTPRDFYVEFEQW